MKIQPINIGLPPKQGTIMFILLIFNTDAIECQARFSILEDNINNQILTEGNVEITPEEFAGWGYDNSYIEDIVLTRLGLTRAE